MQGFLLGLSTGAVCLAYCAPTLVPYLLGEGKGIRQSGVILCQFLGGRLCGYLIFAVVAWALNQFVIIPNVDYESLLGLVYIVLAMALAFYGLRNNSAPCAGRSFNASVNRILGRWPALMAVSLGFFTGLNLCPAFLLALASACELNNLSQSLLFFFSFFLGTTLYFIPAPLLGAFKGLPTLRIIGKMAAVITAIYYLYTGIIMFVGGMNFL
ncbi:MAG: hypothetical protein H6Q73_292 [Firmicutes bacterium]|nr:hypothetical protein [Bacillota bacterium]